MARKGSVSTVSTVPIPKGPITVEVQPSLAEAAARVLDAMLEPYRDAITAQDGAQVTVQATVTAGDVRMLATFLASLGIQRKKRAKKE